MSLSDSLSRSNRSLELTIPNISSPFIEPTTGVKRKAAAGSDTNAIEVNMNQLTDLSSNQLNPGLLTVKEELPGMKQSENTTVVLRKVYSSERVKLNLKFKIKITQFRAHFSCTSRLVIRNSRFCFGLVTSHF